MSYINYEILTSKNLSLYELPILQLIKQNKTEDLSNEIKFQVEDTQFIEKWLNIGYIEVIKGKKCQTEYQKLRTTKLGNKVLEDIGTADITEDSLKIFDWISELYKQSGKDLGNQKKTKQFIAQFSKESGIEKNSLAFLIQSFVNDESQFDWSKVLQYLFFKGDSVFAVRFDLHSSRLYQFYQKNEDYFREQFKKWEE